MAFTVVVNSRFLTVCRYVFMAGYSEWNVRDGWQWHGKSQTVSSGFVVRL